MKCQHVTMHTTFFVQFLFLPLIFVPSLAAPPVFSPPSVPESALGRNVATLLNLNSLLLDKNRVSTKNRDSSLGQAPNDTIVLKEKTAIELLSSTALQTFSTMDASLLTEPRPNIDQLLCNCSVEGSVAPHGCDQYTGQCICMSGYTGLQCSVCQDDHFPNSSTACLPCGCDQYGALSSDCDSTGLCVCKSGVSGDKCDECRPGYFHFSISGCQPCQCNNHSSYCHPHSGICLNCQGNTEGPRCEECMYSFYRRPDTALTEVCVPCPCSSVTSSGSCHIDPSGLPVCDQCKLEYQGPHCDQCRDGFYNSDSICLACNCNGNADPGSLPRLCHPETGHCLSCANNTVGKNCEHCAEGYVGNALTYSCSLEAVPPSTISELSTTSTTIYTALTLWSKTIMTWNSTLPVPLASSSPAVVTNTTAVLTGTSWTQFSVIILVVIMVLVLLLMGVVAGVFAYQKYYSSKLNAPFWTLELKEDSISFSSYHDCVPSNDVSDLLEEEVNEVVSHGHLALSSTVSIYKA